MFLFTFFHIFMLCRSRGNVNRGRTTEDDEKRIVLRSALRNRESSCNPFCFSSKASSNRHVRTRSQGVHPQDRHLDLVWTCVHITVSWYTQHFNDMINNFMLRNLQILTIVYSCAIHSTVTRTHRDRYFSNMSRNIQQNIVPRHGDK